MIELKYSLNVLFSSYNNLGGTPNGYLFKTQFVGFGRICIFGFFRGAGGQKIFLVLATLPRAADPKPCQQLPVGNS